ncbi:MAG: hypothetical protein P8016_15820 [Sedimentisphaerales bacterium]
MLFDGRVFSWSEDGTLRLWDIQRGSCLAVLKGHSSEVQTVQTLSDCRFTGTRELRLIKD